MLTDQQAMYVEGVGYLDQYGSYMDTLWSKGVVYFLRDSLLRDVEFKLEAGYSPKSVRPLVHRLNALNSDIKGWEQNGGQVEVTPRTTYAADHGAHKERCANYTTFSCSPDDR